MSSTYVIASSNSSSGGVQITVVRLPDFSLIKDLTPEKAAITERLGPFTYEIGIHFKGHLEAMISYGSDEQGALRDFYSLTAVLSQGGFFTSDSTRFVNVMAAASQNPNLEYQTR